MPGRELNPFVRLLPCCIPSLVGELERKNRILSRDIEAVDMRLPDRLIVQTKSGRLPTAGNGGRDT